MHLVDLKSIPLLDNGKNFLGKTFSTWMQRPDSVFSDCVDRLNCFVVPLIFMLFVGIATVNLHEWAGKPG